MATEPDSAYPKAAAWLVLLVLVSSAAAAGTVFVLRTPTVPHDCEQDQYFLAADKLICGEERLIQSTVGPVVPWLIAILGIPLGSTYLAGRLLNVLAGALLLGLVYHAGRVHGRAISAGLLAAGLLLLVPDFLFYGTLACTDVPAALLMLLSLHFAISSHSSPEHLWRPGLAGLVAMLACLTRHQAYPFAAGLGLSLVLANPIPWKARLKSLALFACGFIGLAVLYVVVADLILSVPPAKALDLGPAALRGISLLRKKVLMGYGYSLGLIALSLGLMLPLAVVSALGLLSNARSRSKTCAALLPAVAYFLGVAWFPRSPNTDLRRLFLILVPMAAVFISLAALGLLRKIVKKKWRVAALPLFAVVLFFAGKETAADATRLFDRVIVSTQSTREMEAARVFKEKERPGCAPVLTPTLAAGTVFTQYHHVDWGNTPFTLEWPAQAIKETISGAPPRFVMVPDDADKNLLAVDVPFGTDGRYRLKKMYSINGFVFYKVSANDPSSIQ